MWFYYSLFWAIWNSISFIIIKRLSRSISSLPLLYTTFLFSIPFMFLLLLITSGIPRVTLHFYLFTLSSAILDTIAFIASFSAIEQSSLSLISPIASFGTVFTLLIAMVTIGEIPTSTKFLGVLLVVIGSYLLNIKDITHGILTPIKKLATNRGVQLFFLATFLWSITPIFQKKAIFETYPQTPLYPSFVGVIIVSTFLTFFAFKKTKSSIQHIQKNVGWFLLLGGVAPFAQFAAFTAFSLAYVGYVSAVLRLSSLFTVILAGVFLKEERLSERFLGASVMIAGTILLAI